MNDSMTFSERLVALVKDFEGLQLTAYRCPAGVLTIGYGHTGPEVVPNLTITLDKADSFLRADLRFAEWGVRTYSKVPLTQGQYDALTDFAFNLGIGALRDSTLMKKVNARDFEGAAAEFGKWVHGGGRVLPGLIKRRAAEVALFRGEA